jgi:hypothetical protein
VPVRISARSLPGFTVAEGSWQIGSGSGNAGYLQLVSVAAFRRGSRLLAEMRAASGTICLHFSGSYPDSICTRARRFLRCHGIPRPSQVCFEPQTRTRHVTLKCHWQSRQCCQCQYSTRAETATNVAQLQLEFASSYVMLPKEPELLRGLRLHWRGEMLMSG